MIKKVSSILLFLGCFSACQTTTKPAKVERYNFSKINTYVRYMAQTRELQAEVTFKADSTTLIDGSVLFDEEVMRPKKLPVVGIQYKILKERVNFKAGYTFQYPEKDGSMVDLPISMNKFQNVRVVSRDGISKTKGGLLQWDGEPLTSEDGLVFIFTDSEGGTFQINHAGITKGNKFEILPMHAQRMALGKGNMLVMRKKTVVEKATEGTVQQMHRIEYYLPAISFEVIE